MIVRVLVQSVLTALFVGLVGFVVWDTVVHPQLISREKEAGAQAQLDRVQLRKDVENARAEKAKLTAEVTSLRGEATTLESQRDRLTSEVAEFNKGNSNVLEKKRKFETEFAELSRKVRALRTEKSTLEIESQVLREEASDLAKQSKELGERVRKLSRTNAATLGENRKLSTENSKLKAESTELTNRVGAQKAAIVAANASLIEAAESLKKEREKLENSEGRFNESREALADGLAAVAKEFRKIAIRNVGLVKERYTVLAEQKEAEIAELDQKVVKLDLGDDVPTAIIQKLKTASASAALVGKIVKIVHLPASKEAAGRVRDTLLSVGVAAALEQTPAKVGNTIAPGISYYSASDRPGAELVEGLLASAEQAGYTPKQESGRRNADFVVWVGGKSDDGKPATSDNGADLRDELKGPSGDSEGDKELEDLLRQSDGGSEDKEDLFQEPPSQ